MTEPSKEELLAEADAATARFEQALPAPRAVTDVGELAAILAQLPPDTPLFLGAHALAQPGPIEEPLHAIVAHLTPCAEPVDPENPDGLHRTRPALGLTVVRTSLDQDPGAALVDDDLEPYDQLARAEHRLESTGNLEGGMNDAADVIEFVASLLTGGSGFLPYDHGSHEAIGVETSRLQHAAARLRKLAPETRKASDQ